MWRIPALLFIVFSIHASRSLAQNNPCLGDTSFHIVVLGSSTAAGAGASTGDSAWVNRYRKHLESINPANQVTNRAQGGYNTYKLMPTGSVPPATRPAPDTVKNITYAISLNPDAIIVNLPSNDVSSGYSVAEQLTNFDTIVAHANNAGIPIWICTTQPKNYGGNPVPIQKQVDVRDSIFVRYSPRVLDFWTGLADSSNQLAAYYDSGDGTHLNDIGHRELYIRAVAADLPGALYLPPAYIDHVADAINTVFAPICGDSFSVFQLSLHNRGPASNADIPLQFIVQNLSNSQQQAQSDTLYGGLQTCIIDSLQFTFNTSVAGTYLIQAVIASPADQNPLNDTISTTFVSLGFPNLTPLPDTGCQQAALTLGAMSDGNDSLRWWDAMSGGNFLSWGNTFTTPVLSSAGSYFYYVEAVRGDLFFKNELSTTYTSNINWNGAMFDLIADSTLVLDSLTLKANSTGVQVVEIYTKSGSHLGYETNSGAWSMLGAYPVQVNAPGDLVTIGIGGLSLNMGDSLGVYLQFQNPGATLSYQSMSQPQTRSTNELRIITGSGASHNFGGNYYPRDWNGTVHYHYGSKPDGDCVSKRIAVEALIGGPQVSLGSDTIVNVNTTITLDAGSGVATYLWSNGSTGQTLLLDGSQWGTGIHHIYVNVTDSAGCMGSDTIIVVFAPLASVAAAGEAGIRLWPNPNSGNFQVAIPAGEWEMYVRDIRGQLIEKRSLECIEDCIHEVNIYGPVGIYGIEFRGGGERYHLRVVLN